MTTEIESVDERHAIRTLVKFAVIVGIVFVAGRFLAQKKGEYANLTESQAREKLVDTIAPRVGDETAEDIANQVIPKLKDRGLIKPDPMEKAADAVVDAAKDVKDKAADAAKDVEKATKSAAKDMKGAAKDAADKVSDAVDSVVKD